MYMYNETNDLDLLIKDQTWIINVSIVLSIQMLGI